MLWVKKLCQSGLVLSSLWRRKKGATLKCPIKMCPVQSSDISRQSISQKEKYHFKMWDDENIYKIVFYAVVRLLQRALTFDIQHLVTSLDVLVTFYFLFTPSEKESMIFSAESKSLAMQSSDFSNELWHLTFNIYFWLKTPSCKNL